MKIVVAIGSTAVIVSILNTCTFLYKNRSIISFLRENWFEEQKVKLVWCPLLMEKGALACAQYSRPLVNGKENSRLRSRAHCGSRVKYNVWTCLLLLDLDCRFSFAIPCRSVSSLFSCLGTFKIAYMCIFLSDLTVSEIPVDRWSDLNDSCICFGFDIARRQRFY